MNIKSFLAKFTYHPFLKRFGHTILVFIYGFLWGFCVCFTFIHATESEKNAILDNAINLKGYNEGKVVLPTKNGEIILKENPSESAPLPKKKSSVKSSQ